MKIESLFREFFYREGRGPELQEVHYAHQGKVIKAVDYFNPDDKQPEGLKHLLFIHSRRNIWPTTNTTKLCFMTSS